MTDVYMCTCYIMFWLSKLVQENTEKRNIVVTEIKDFILSCSTLFYKCKLVTDT